MRMEKEMESWKGKALRACEMIEKKAHILLPSPTWAVTGNEGWWVVYFQTQHDV
jgi:hypothetical protein